MSADVTSTPFQRLRALIRKETRQMVRDRSTLALGVILPVFLLMLFGYGLSLDVQDVPVAVVQETPSPETRDLFAHLEMSPFFSPRLYPSMHEAEELLRTADVDAIVRMERRAIGNAPQKIQIIVNGNDANRARIMQRYLEGAIAQWSQSWVERQGTASRSGSATAETRLWFNPGQESSYFLVPGVTVLIMTLIGALLTALVVAREWEQGTFEALFVTPVHPEEILLGKLFPYFCLGMVGLMLCLGISYFVFGVPMRGSLIAIVGGSALYLVVALGIGLVISSLAKSQFLASQIALISTFVPTLMLSGFLFDLNSMPVFVRTLAWILPATWYVDLLQSLFLVGNVPSAIALDCAVLAGFAALLMVLARRATRKRLM